MFNAAHSLIVIGKASRVVGVSLLAVPGSNPYNTLEVFNKSQIIGAFTNNTVLLVLGSSFPSPHRYYLIGELFSTVVYLVLLGLRVAFRLL